MMDFDEFLKQNKVKYKLDVRRFRILKLDHVPEFSECIFSITKDKNEVTVIASGNIDVNALSEEKYFRLLTFDLTLPFNLAGFLNYMTAILANVKVPVFAISSYSTDHLLIRERFLARAMKALDEEGIIRS